MRQPRGINGPLIGKLLTSRRKIVKKLANPLVFNHLLKKPCVFKHLWPSSEVSDLE
jgi:hypothetical protein